MARNRPVRYHAGMLTLLVAIDNACVRLFTHTRLEPTTMATVSQCAHCGPATRERGLPSSTPAGEEWISHTPPRYGHNRVTYRSNDPYGALRSGSKPARVRLSYTDWQSYTSASSCGQAPGLQTVGEQFFFFFINNGLAQKRCRTNTTCL